MGPLKSFRQVASELHLNMLFCLIGSFRSGSQARMAQKVKALQSGLPYCVMQAKWLEDVCPSRIALANHPEKRCSETPRCAIPEASKREPIGAF